MHRSSAYKVSYCISLKLLMSNACIIGNSTHLYQLFQIQMHSKLVILIDFLVLERVFYFTLNYHSGIGSPLSLQSLLQR